MTTPARKRLTTIISDMSDDEVHVLLSVLERPEYCINKRKYSRMHYSVPVGCVSNGRGIHANLRDLSVGGVFIEMISSENPFVVGQELLLKIPYPNKEKYARICGKVVRAALDGVGVEFKSMGVESV